jgi:hypothetical protein
MGLTAILQSASPAELAGIVVADTWLDVLDRKKPEPGQWNLLLDTRGITARLVAIDYGLALGEILGPPILGAASMVPRCPVEWLPHVAASDVSAAIRDTQQVPRHRMDDLVRSLPWDWRAELPRCSELPDYLEQRQKMLQDCLRG